MSKRTRTKSSTTMDAAEACTGVRRVAICGAGTVGGAVLQILERKAAYLAQVGIKLVVTKVLVRDPTKKRDFELPEGAEYVTDWRTIVEDKELDIVLELMGGTGSAKEIVFGSLRAGKHVVTANKALIASSMLEIEELLLAGGGACKFGYEAAVCGGIPIIKTLLHGMAGDKVTQLAGIMNGTTNFMLSSMESAGASYDAILKEAQDKGFAEADPTADVEGYDARAKLCILTRLATGVRVAEADIPCVGISRVTAADMRYASMTESSIKLLGVCRVVGAELQAFVHPCLVAHPNMIARTSGAANIVEITSTSLGKSYLIGQGAGGFPTANSVVSDLLAIAQNSAGAAFPPPSTELKLNPDFTGRFYIRINVADERGIIGTAGALCDKCGVSIHSVLQTPILDHSDLPFVITTELCNANQVRAFCTEVTKQSWCLREPFMMPILDS